VTQVFTISSVFALLILGYHVSRGHRLLSVNRDNRGRVAKLMFLIGLYCCLDITHELTYFLGIRSRSPFEANLLNYLWPLWLALATGGAGNKTARGLGKTVGLAVLAIAGLAVMTIADSGGDFHRFAPAVYGLVSSLGGAGYMIIFIRLAREFDMSVVPMLAINMTVCSILLWFANPASAAQIPQLSETLPLLIYLSLFTVVVPEILWSYFLKSQRVRSDAMSGFLIPLLSTAWLAIIRREAPSASVMVGGVMILIALLGSSLLRAKESATT
jgi:drug/metabolite transporter (DMT)-like permease